MRKILAVILILSFNVSFAISTGYKNETATTKTYAQDLVFPNNQLTKQVGLDSRVETGNDNLLVNPSFEHSTLGFGWTKTSGVWAVDSTNVVDGKKAINGAYSAGFDISQISTINAAKLSGLQMVASIYLWTDDSTLQVCAVVNSVDTNCVTPIASTTFKSVIIPFIAGGTNNGIRIKTSTGSMADTHLDGAYVGLSYPFQNVSGAKLYGTSSSTGSASCIYTTSSTSYVGYSANASCSSQTVTGNIKAASTKIPGFILPSGSPAGTYKIVATAPMVKAGSVADYTYFRLHDGTNAAIGNGFAYTQTVGGGNGTLEGVFSYSTAQSSDLTIQIQGTSTSASNQAIIDNSQANSAITFSVYYYPPDTKNYSQSVAKPVVRYTSSQSSTITSGGTLRINYETKDFETVSAVTTGASWLYTSTEDAYYQISTRLGFLAGNNTGQAVDAFIFKNGVSNQSLGRLLAGASTGPTNGNMGTGIVYLAKGDTFYIQAQNNGGVTLTQNADPKENWITISKVAGLNGYDTISGSFAGLEKCANDYECTDTFSAKVSSTGVVTDQNIPWINGNFTISPTGVFTASLLGYLKDGVNGLSTKLNCVAAQSEGVGGSGINASYQEATSTTSTIVVSTANAGTTGNYRFTIKCQKGTNDYKPKTAKVATSIGVPTVPGITTSGTGNSIDTFSFSYGTTNATTVCSASPCSYLDQIGNGVSSVTRTSAGLYVLNTSKTYSKLKCTFSMLGATAVTSDGASCSSCNALSFSSYNTSSTRIDSYGTAYCQGSY